MTAKIELDYQRVMKYQELVNNVKTVEEFFRQGDALIVRVNAILREAKELIDTESETSFTRDDFDVMLKLRNDVLDPINQNLSQTLQFDYYTVPTVDPIVEPAV